MNDDSHISDNEMRTAQALFDLQTLIADQQRLIDRLTIGYRSHHAAILAQIEVEDELRHRVEQLEAS